ncbi:MAG: type II secretion system protein GspM [Colwellia sp.]
MKERWQQLNLREQRLVMAMAVVIGIFLIYSLVWLPLNNGLAKANDKLARQQALLVWVIENTQHFKQINSKNSKPKSGGSLSSIINRTANQHQLTITRMQPQGSNLQVWIDEAPFTQLLFWLEYLAKNEGLEVKNIDLSKSDIPGKVAVRRLQLGK